MRKIRVDRVEWKYRNFVSFISFAMILLFAFLPLFSIVNPSQYGEIFVSFAKIEMAVFSVVMTVYGVISFYSYREDSLLNKLKNFAGKIWGYFRNNKPCVLLLTAYLLCVLSAFFAPDRQRAFSGTDFRPDGVIVYTAMAVLFVFASFLKNDYQKKTVMGMYIAAFFLNALVMFCQHYGMIGLQNEAKCPAAFFDIREFFEETGFRVGHFYKGLTGGFYNSNHIGYFLTLTSMIIVACFVFAKKMWLKILFALLSVFAFWSIIVNNSFGSYVSTAIVMLILPVVFFVRDRNLKSVINAALPFILMIAVSFCVYVDGRNIVKSNLKVFKNDVTKIASDSSGAQKAGSGRWELWKETVDMIGDKPVLGYGPDNVDDEYKTRDLDMTRAHNEFLEIAVSCGVVAAVCYFAAIIMILLKKWKNVFKNKLSASGVAFLMACSAYFISSMTGVFLFYTASHFVIMLSLLKDE